MKDRTTKLYNILFPIWLLIWFPLFWIVLIPANYAIDYFVLYCSLKGNAEKKTLCRKNTWKICLVGFFADCLGSGFLFLIMLLTGSDTPNWVQQIGPALNMNPFETFMSFLVTTLAVVFSAAMIYFLDRIVLQRAGMSEKQVRKSAFFLAAFTAPYLFLIPSKILYI